MLQLISNKYNVNIRVIQVFHIDGESTITPQTEIGYESGEKEIILLYYSELRFLSGHYISVKKTQTKELDLSNILGEHEVSANEVSTNELSSLHFNSYAEPTMEHIDTPKSEKPKKTKRRPAKKKQSEEPPTKKPQSEKQKSDKPPSEQPPAKKTKKTRRKR